MISHGGGFVNVFSSIKKRLFRKNDFAAASKNSHSENESVSNQGAATFGGIAHEPSMYEKLNNKFKIYRSDGSVRMKKDYIFDDIDYKSINQDGLHSSAELAAAEGIDKKTDVNNILSDRFRSGSADKIDKLKWLGGALSVKKSQGGIRGRSVLKGIESVLDTAVTALNGSFGDDKQTNDEMYEQAVKSVENLAACCTKYNLTGEKTSAFKNTSEVNIIVRELGSTAFAVFNSLVIAKSAFLNASAESQRLNTIKNIVRSPDSMELAQSDSAADVQSAEAEAAARRDKIEALKQQCAELLRREYKGLDGEGRTYRISDFKSHDSYVSSEKKSDFMESPDFYERLADYEQLAETSVDSVSGTRYSRIAENIRRYIADAEEYYVAVFKMTDLLREEAGSTYSQKNMDNAAYFKYTADEENLVKNKGAKKANAPGFGHLDISVLAHAPNEGINFYRKKTDELFDFQKDDSGKLKTEEYHYTNSEGKDATSPFQKHIVKNKSATKEEFDALWLYSKESRTVNALAAGYKGGEWGEQNYKGENIDFDADEKKIITDGEVKSSGDADILRKLTSLIEKSRYDKDVWLQSGQSFLALEKFLGMGTESGYFSEFKDKMEKDEDGNIRDYSDIVKSDEFMQANREARKYIGCINEIPQFLSTTFYKGGGGSFNAAPVKLNIFAPKGSEMLYVSDLGFYGGSEQEVILQRGGTYMIHDIYWGNDGTSMGGGLTLFVDMELRPEHGYNKKQQNPDNATAAGRN